MNYPTQAFGPPPPSPVSRAFAAAATSPGPVQDLSSYINSAANTSADGLGYTATSPQPTGFGHAITVRGVTKHMCFSFKTSVLCVLVHFKIDSMILQ